MNSGNNKESNKQEKQDLGRNLRHFLIVNLKKKKIGLSWHKLIKKSIKALLKFEIVKNFKTENMRK